MVGRDKGKVLMAGFIMRLPAKEPSLRRLLEMDQESRDQLLEDLLNAVWKSEESGDLPSHLTRSVRAWVAHARFEADPVVMERLQLFSRAGGLGADQRSKP